ncbi:hypothetical protein AMTRI_Chr09g34290 [Amborella trichopoda]
MVASSENSLALFELDEDELFDFVVKKGHGVKGLVDSGISRIPCRYIHPPYKLADLKKVSNFPTLPLFDLSGLCDGSIKSTIAREICEATKKFGFFQVINYGMPLELLDRLMNSTREFFRLPAEKKAYYLKEVSPFENVYYGTSFAPQAEKWFEWKDYLSMFGKEEERAFWPQECRDVAQEYLKMQEPLIYFIMNSLLKGLGVPIDDEAIKSYMESQAVNMNYYPVCPNPELTVGVGPHSDLAALTFLLQDDIGGLHLKVEDEGWVEIVPTPGALIVNVGDTLEILSNGRYKSVEHMARVSNTRDRISIPIFVSPRPETRIGPLQGLAEKDGGAIYRDLVFGEYMNNFFSAAHDGKKTLDFARSMLDQE